MVIRGILFDFDGTLTEPGSLDFNVIREAVGCPSGQPVLEFIESIDSEARRAEVAAILDRFEAEAARRSRPNQGAEELIRRFISQNIKVGIISRNSMTSIREALGNFERIQAQDFAVILSRDDPFSPKPSPEGILEAAKRMEIPVAELVVVGDFVFDIIAGREAGAPTVYLTNRGLSHPCTCPPDFTIEQLSDLVEIVRLYTPLQPGKLPNDLLERFLREVVATDGSLLIPPAVGEDVAAVAYPDGEVLVLKSDPITFATESLAAYAVTVNVNDIAASGAVPRWILPTLLLPPGTTAARIRSLMADLSRTARGQGLILCGGHTEITDAVNRPVVVVQAAGTVARKDLIEKKNMKEGDLILLTKGVAVEGTSLIAREFAGRLADLGLGTDEIERCRRFLSDPGISVFKEARIAARSGAATAMHDVTEGGLATAVEEFSAAGGHRIRIRHDKIFVFEETRRICALLEIDPLGLIGSGSLLIACSAAKAPKLLRSLDQAGIHANCIGEVLEKGSGVEARDSMGSTVPWPHFEADEITRLYGRTD